MRGHLTRVKDKLETSKNSSVVYKITCSCERVYIGETVRRLEQRITEHKDACKKGKERKSALAEHSWQHQHPILWNQATIIDRAQGIKQLRIKEALHIFLTPEDQHFNRDVGLELPTCWKSILYNKRKCSRSSGKGSSTQWPPLYISNPQAIAFSHKQVYFISIFTPSFNLNLSKHGGFFWS